MNESLRYSLVLAACVILSIAGIIIGALYCRPLDGVRGGAIAVGLALVTMFLSRDYGSLPIDAVSSRLSWLRRKLGQSAAQPALADIAQRLDRIESQVVDISKAIQASKVISSGDVRRQNIFLALSSGVGTAAWGFGDLASQWLINLAGQCPPV